MKLNKKQKQEIRNAFETVREYCKTNRYCVDCILNHGGTKFCDAADFPCDWSFNDELEEIE